MRSCVVALLFFTSCDDVWRTSEHSQNVADAGYVSDVDGSSSATTKLFRVSDATLRDPHVFADPPLFDCRDVTYDGLLGFNSANETLAEALIDDDNKDRVHDFAVLIELRDDVAAIGEATCFLGSDRCEEEFDESLVDLYFKSDGFCFEPDPTFIDFEPTPATVEGPCFATSPTDLQFDFGKSKVRFLETTVSARFEGDELHGVMVGYVTRTEAQNTKVRGGTLDEFLPGALSCNPLDATDEGLGQTSGWWFFVDFVATPAKFSRQGGGCCASVAPRSDPSLITLVVILTTLSFRRRSRGRRDGSSPGSRSGSSR